MIYDAFLQLALLAISLACYVLLFWLALTVALTAERRGWGLAFTCAALVLAGLFFVFHAILVSQGLENVYVAALSQWPLGWMFGCALTLCWYGVTLWYAGFWEKPDSLLRRRHRALLVLAVLGGAVVAGSLLLADPLPIHMPRLAAGAPAWSAVARWSLPTGLYPLFATGCVLLALDALRFTVPSARPMGDIAHRRARPWLVGTSLVLLLVGLAVTGAMLTLLVAPGRGEAEYEAAGFASLLATGDLLASGLILVGVLFLGQAVASYELFTGRALPRQGLRSNWWGAVVLAFALGGTMALAVTLALPPVFVALLGCGAASALYAVYNRQTYVEHERHLATLRPLVASERTYDAIFGPASPALDATTPFRALCGEVLGVRLAYLAAQGPLAALLGQPLSYPDKAPDLPGLVDLASRCDSPRSLQLAVDPTLFGGARWAVPLWGAQGLVGVFLLGEKADGSLFAQEELEVARAGGERLVDLLATAQMARRLAELQRSHLAETQVADQRTRRLLHDHILPELHEVLLGLSATAGGGPSLAAAERLAGVHRQLSNLLRDLPRTAAAPEVARRGLVEALRLLAVEEMAAAFTEVHWSAGPEAAALAGKATPLRAEV
ncbi:MAG: sensor histidine kinase, partial [Chloroflexota bacterium]